MMVFVGSTFAVTVPVSEDTTTTPKGTVTTGTGKATTLMVQPERDALIKFNLDGLPSGYTANTLQSARLRVYVARISKPGDISVNLSTQDWSEKTNGDAPVIDANPISTIAAADLSSKSYVVVDITTAVQQWMTDPTTNFGVAVISAGATPTAKVVLAAKEGPGTGPAAELELEAAIPGGPSGSGNTISLSADFAAILNGQNNVIGDNGDFSIAAGRRAKVNHTGSFVWADSTNADFSSTADNQFRIRASNGLSLSIDGGSFNTLPIGTYFRDNSIVAWGRVNLNGGLEQNFNVASITKVSTGVYRVTLKSSLQSGFNLIATVTPEIDSTVSEPADPVPPVGAANVRITAVDKVASGDHFNVYIYNGSYALVDNDFDILVTGR